MLSPAKNPFFEHADAAYFLAERGGLVEGRVAAIANRLHNETHGDRVGFFGFFESVDDQAVAGALLDAAAGWLRARRMRPSPTTSTGSTSPTGRCSRRWAA